MNKFPKIGDIIINMNHVIAIRPAIGDDGEWVLQVAYINNTTIHITDTPEVREWWEGFLWRINHETP